MGLFRMSVCVCVIVAVGVSKRIVTVPGKLNSIIGNNFRRLFVKKKTKRNTCGFPKVFLRTRISKSFYGFSDGNRIREIRPTFFLTFVTF